MTASGGREAEPDRPAPRLVRPYALTGGRARNLWTDLELEALLSATSGATALVAQSPEQRTIAQLCHHRFQSVAEISALLKLPLGVVRVLVGEMVDRGVLELYQPRHQAEHPDRALLERVLDGLRRI
jgi:DNA-directed RNA polymerase specialized sigma24 family protein